MKNVAVIMAGGKGERFWPMSTKDKPKQFLNLIDPDCSMLQLTVNRVLPIVDMEDIYVVTNINYKDLVYQQLPDVPKENILFEPIGKNTAPCIGFATAVIKKRYGNANIIVLSSDSMITNNKLFLENLKTALLYCNDRRIITLGIVPTRAETGYGYVKIGDKFNNDNIYNVDCFVEKPCYELAKEYCDSQSYLWNSGMFIWENETMYSKLEENLPQIFNGVNNIYNSVDTSAFYDVVDASFEKFDSISIDYGVMEHSDNIFVVPCNCGWDDVGSWLSVERLRQNDSDFNVYEGNTYGLYSDHNVVINKDDDLLIATVGLENTIVVKNGKILLIMNKDNVSDIKKIQNEISKTKYKKFL